MKNKIVSLSLFLAASTTLTAQAECPKWERLSASAQKSMDAGDLSKAEQIWLKAVAESDFCGERDPAAPLSLKRLGECYQKDGKFIEAADAYKRSAERFKINGVDDTELASDLASLAKVYRTIEFSELNKSVANAFKESGVNLIGLCKIDQGNHIQMNLNDKFVKQLENPDVDQVALDKMVAFDVIEQPDGSLAINNIKGLKVHAKMWVSIIQSRIQPKNADGASAEVTATKMGITKTVSCKLPSDSIDPMNALIAKLHDFNNGVSTSNKEVSTLNNEASTTEITPQNPESSTPQNGMTAEQAPSESGSK